MIKTLIDIFFRDEEGNEDKTTTWINCPPEETEKYYLGRWFNRGPRHTTTGMRDDWMMRCYKVEILDMEIK